MTVLVTRDDRLIPAGFPNIGADYQVISGGSGAIKLAGELTRTYETIYESNPNCWAVVNKIARLVATLPVKLYDRPAAEDAPEEVRNHPAGRLLNEPAPRRGQAYWKQGLVRSALVHGNGLLYKWRSEGEPKALLDVSWPYVAAYAPLGCPVRAFSTFQTGEMRAFGVDEAVHLAWESGNVNGLGVSPLLALAESIKLDDSLRRYQTAQMGSGNRPAGAIVPPPEFRYQGTEREMLRKEIERLHGSPDQVGKMALLAPGFKWENLSHTAVEAEVIAARTLGREEFAMVYDVPPVMIGDLTHGTYSNVEELHRILYVTTLRPWFAIVEEILQRQLIDEEESWSGDLYARFDLSEVLRGNRREEIDAASEAFNNGLMTLNEAREFLDMPPVSGEVDPEGMADVPHVQANNMQPITGPLTAASDPEALPAGNPNEVPPKPVTPTKAQRDRPLNEDVTNR